ncbi:MAG: hypothetical protein JNM00_14140, partial [Flavobacteriales bacterium]|nr:hypothetical protein [Flavobacteriales bacterium]
MPSVSFLLRDPYQAPGKLKSTPCTIFISVIESRAKRAKIKTTYKILPKDWNFDKQEAKVSHPNFFDLNHYLAEMRQRILREFLQHPGRAFADNLRASQ